MNVKYAIILNNDQECKKLLPLIRKISFDDIICTDVLTDITYLPDKNVFAKKWFLDPDEVGYEVYNYKDGVIANENNLKEKANYAEYKKQVSDPLPKFKFRKEMIEAFRNELMVNVEPLLK